MKSPSKDVPASLRSQRPATSGPGPTEKGRVKQGMSAGIWPGTRHAGCQPPGTRKDGEALDQADALGRLAGQ